MKRRILSLLLPCCIAVVRLQAQTGIDVPSMHEADTLIMDFMQAYGIPGATVAITKDGRLIYNRAFGYADQAATEPMQPYHLQRIASNSKAITSIAIMKLIENGQLGLGDTVFGASRILTQPYYLGAITDSRIYDITVKELLEHTAGWDRDIACDGFSHCDPIGFPLHVTSTLGEGNPVGDSALIKFLLGKGLDHAPGTTYAYSNIGYLVLAKVIEQKTGMKYEDYVSSIIMQPLGLQDMHLGKNLLADKQEREAEYNNSATTKSCYGTGATVPWQYGGWNLEAMHAHGGWISTSEDYSRMILAVDGKTTVPDILSPASVTTMVTPSSANASYAKGWSVNSFGNWWHTGSLDGTATFMARTSGGYTWAIHLNKRSTSSSFWSALDDLPWDCLAATPTFPAHNLFAPMTQAGGLAAVKTGPASVHLTWTAGSGDMRTVLATEGSGWKSFPLAGVSYSGNSVYGLGPALGNSTFVVYDGAGADVEVTGLDPAKTYLFTVLEGYNNSVTGSKTVYKYGGRSQASVNMASTSIAPTGNANGIALYPNPAGDRIVLHTAGYRLQGTTASITDVQGRKAMDITIREEAQSVDLQALPAGVYALRLVNGSTLRLIKW
jgi:CubicO group peptidase (beta-lactamase class C family)